MNQQELDKFTLLIENYNYDNNETITPQSLHKELWGGLSALKNTANKEALLDGWKYSSAFSAAESTHPHHAGAGSPPRPTGSGPVETRLQSRDRVCTPAV